MCTHTPWRRQVQLAVEGKEGKSESGAPGTSSGKYVVIRNGKEQRRAWPGPMGHCDGTPKMYGRKSETWCADSYGARSTNTAYCVIMLFRKYDILSIHTGSRILM